MLKNLSQIEFIVDDKTGRFICDIDTPLIAVKEMLFQIQKYIGQIEDNIRKQQEEQKKEETPPVEEVNEEPKP